MDDIQQALRIVWQRISSTLQNDPKELERRLARRQSALLQHPPRAWCIAIRVTDTRLDACCTSIPDTGRRHDVILDSPILKKLCVPVFRDPPGQTLRQVAAKLGVKPHALLHARLSGLFQTRHVPGLGGRQPHLHVSIADHTAASRARINPANCSTGHNAGSSNSRPLARRNRGIDSAGGGSGCRTMTLAKATGRIGRCFGGTGEGHGMPICRSGR